MCIRDRRRPGSRPDDLNAGGNGRKNMLRTVEDSLRRLNTDHIDLLLSLIHILEFPDDLPLVRCDYGLLLQALGNVVESYGVAVGVELYEYTRFSSGLLSAAEPVSYTHLDVYKRQGHVCADPSFR